MTELRWLQMPRDELDEFLGDGGTGVLSFTPSASAPPHSVPVSYGYDAETGHFHFRLGEPPGSEKADLFDRPVSFVTYDETEHGWQSVVATGTLEDLSELPYESAALQERWAVSIPTVDIFDEPPEKVEFRPFRLVPDEVSGRKEVEESA